MRDMVKFLYTHNPFYLISAAFVLYGLRVAFRADADQWINIWLLMASIVGYTTLLAITAWIIVRFGKVWDDARMLALLVVLLFVAVSSSFDEICLTLPETARRVLSLSLLFSIGLTTVLLYGMRVKLPWEFRLPFYGMLCLFFLFPMSVMTNWAESLNLSIAARVSLFPSLAAILTLGLLPAVWSGNALMKDNGSPWPWPWYPWTIFLFLAIGVCTRSYMLTVSFQSDVAWDSTFGFYYLLPFGFAVLLVLAEMGVVERLPRLQNTVFWGPVLLILMALPHQRGQSYQAFFTDVASKIGAPLWLTVLGSLGFYTYLWIRGLKRADWGAIALLGLGAFVGPTTLRMTELQLTQVWPLAAIVCIALMKLYRERTSVSFLFVVAVLAIGLGVQFHGDARDMKDLLLPIHVAMAGAVCTGFLFSDPLADFLRRWTPIGFLSLILVAIGFLHSNVPLVSMQSAYLYMFSLIAIGIGIWLLHRTSWWKIVSALGGLSVLLSGGFDFLRNIETRIPEHALAMLLIGLGSFVVGLIVSAVKGGLGPSLIDAIQWERQRIAAEWIESGGMNWFQRTVFAPVPLREELYMETEPQAESLIEEKPS
jgi:hypothetical protein